MNSPDNIYNVESPQPGTADASRPSGTGYVNSSPGPQSPQPQQVYYYQQPPTFGCGAFVGRLVASIVVLFVCGFLFLIFLSAMGTAMMSSMEQVTEKSNRLNERFVTGDENAETKIAILSIDGMIMESEEGYIPKQIRQILDDENVAAIVLRVDSPGGTMTGSDYYYYLLKRMKDEKGIPVVVSMGSMATSGGYYVSMVGDEIYAERTTITGSIGVIVPMYKGVGLCEKIGIESTPITSGPLKTMGSFDKPLTDEQRAVWQRLVDDNFARFKEVVKEGREEFRLDPKRLDDLATGQIYTATEAEANGLVDKIGYIDDAIESARIRAGLPAGGFKVVRYKSKSSFMNMMLESRGPETVLNADTLTNLTTPRVYMLCPDVLPLKAVE